MPPWFGPPFSMKALRRLHQRAQLVRWPAMNSRPLSLAGSWALRQACVSLEPSHGESNYDRYSRCQKRDHLAPAVVTVRERSPCRF